MRTMILAIDPGNVIFAPTYHDNNGLWQTCQFIFCLPQTSMDAFTNSGSGAAGYEIEISTFPDTLPDFRKLSTSANDRFPPVSVSRHSGQP